MAKIHVLKADNNGKYSVVIHTPTPAGNNSVGESWKNAGLQGGDLGKTAMTVGTGPGQTTQIEFDSIINGDVMEFQGSFLAESGGTSTPEIIAALTQMVDQRIIEEKTRLQRVYKYFGHTQE